MPNQIEQTLLDDFELVYNYLRGNKKEKPDPKALNILKQLKQSPIWKSAIEKKQLVYAMQQVHNLTVAGMDSKDQEFYSKGICLGISVRWLDLRKHNKDYAHKYMFCSDVSSLTLQIQKNSESNKKTTSTSAALKSQGFKILSNNESVNWKTPLITATGMAIFCSKEHAMAIHVKNNKVHFLDPNYGHFRFDTRGDFLSMYTQINTRGDYKSPYNLYSVQ